MSNSSGNQPLVSICSITFNHKKYIRAALDSFLMQQTTFPFEIIVNDDASTDGTTEILKEYHEKYPDIIVPVFHKENQYSKGLRSLTARNTFTIARGKYLALCEGDDYWTDPLKLQKQVDFLEQNPDCSCCYHPVQWIYANGTKTDRIEGPLISEVVKFPPETIIGGYFIRMVTIMLRADVFRPIPEWIYNSPNGDMPIQLICASQGNIGYLGGQVMAIYRRGGEGAWSQNELGDKKVKGKWVKKWLNDNIKMLDLFNENSGYKFNEILERRKRKITIMQLSYLQEDSRWEAAKLVPKYIGQFLRVTDRRVIKFWLRMVFGKRRKAGAKVSNQNANLTAS